MNIHSSGSPPSRPPLRKTAVSSNSLSGNHDAAGTSSGGDGDGGGGSDRPTNSTALIDDDGPFTLSFSSQLPFSTSVVREQSLALGHLEQLSSSPPGSLPPRSMAPTGRSWGTFSEGQTGSSAGGNGRGMGFFPPLSVHFDQQIQNQQSSHEERPRHQQQERSIWPHDSAERRKRGSADERSPPSGLSLLLGGGNNNSNGRRAVADEEEGGPQEVIIGSLSEFHEGGIGRAFLPSTSVPLEKPHYSSSSSFFAPSRSASTVGLAFRDRNSYSENRFPAGAVDPDPCDDYNAYYADPRRRGGSHSKRAHSFRKGFLGMLQNAFGIADPSSAEGAEADRLLGQAYPSSGPGGYDSTGVQDNNISFGPTQGGGGGGQDTDGGIWDDFKKTQWNQKTLVQKCLVEPVGFIPAVVLGLLLNLLDAVSYGMIIFPLNTVPFQALGPDGISMFFVSCIISQLVFSLGGSAFRGGTGGMMIEVVPFLHLMAETVVSRIGAENREEVLATTILAFALSAIMTGVVFMSLGFFKLGSLIGFFPRHILVGCIGGVGWFLIVTGLEVSSRMTSELTYSWETFKFLFLDRHIFALWFTAFALALLLRALQQRIRHPFLVPGFFMIVPTMFYLVVAVAGLDWDMLRDNGWVFPMPPGNAPGWQFYTYFDIRKTNWSAVLDTVPAMMALTFFGILHVPINVPALGVSTGQDNVDINRELMAHGWSNMLSGCFGTLQNYLVYTNSVLFIKSGGDSRVAGLMLAAATLAVFLIGPWIVGYIPVMVVGSLIFHLGMDLVKEALVDTWGLVHRYEYLTIVLIVAFMAGMGFVEGIFLGILLACIFFVVTNSRKEGVRYSCTGASAKSTVRRVYRQQKFLRQVGRQIYIFKLQGDMFFGTINKVESAIQDVFERRRWRSNPISFLVLDFSLVGGVDFSAAEGFSRIRRAVRAKGVWLVLAGLDRDGEMAKALHMDGIWGAGSGAGLGESHGSPNGIVDTRAFPGLSEALEFCENCLLEMFYKTRETTEEFSKRKRMLERPSQEDMSSMISPEAEATNFFADNAASSPRKSHLFEAARETLLAHDRPQPMNLQQPVPTLLAAFHDTRDNPTDFFLRLSMYFERRTVMPGTVLWHQGGLPTEGIYLVESGTLRSVQEFQDCGMVRKSVEAILPGTISGEVGLFTGNDRVDTLVSETDGVIWGLNQDGFQKMVKEDPALAVEFMRVAMSYSAERLNITAAYAFSLS